jgi:tRNA pseudouridine13 synthase
MERQNRQPWCRSMQSDGLLGKFGVTGYGTSFGGIGGRLKEKPEDFVVAELLNSQGRDCIRPAGSGFPLFILMKRSMDEFTAKRRLQHLTGLRVNILGLKDKEAVTYQFASVRRRADVQKIIDLGSGRAVHVADSARPLTRGDMFGNAFRTTLRGVRWEEECLLTLTSALEEGRIPNFYGEQRFGISNSNHIVGKCLVGRKFDEAANLIFGGNPPYADPIRSIRMLPVRLRRLFVASYQSFLFNKCLSLMLAEGGLPQAGPGLFYRFSRHKPSVAESVYDTTKRTEDVVSVRLCPLPGYSFRKKQDEYWLRMAQVMEEEGVRPADFYLKEMQEVSAEGGLRASAMIGWIRGWQLLDSVKISYVLYKGEYATVLLRELMK